MRSVNESNSKVFDEIESQQRLSNDFNSAAGRILIVSPYATVHAVQRWRSHLERAMNDRGVSVCAFIQRPRHWDRRHEATLAADDVSKLKLVEAAVELLQSLGVHVTLRPKMHEKLIVIDDGILWEGSMNVLSWFNTTERYRRFHDRAEVDDAMQRHKLVLCSHCASPTISQVLLERRLSLGMTQHETASLAGTHRKVVLGCESGKRDVRLGMLERICGALGLEVQVIPKYLGQATRRLVQVSHPREAQSRKSILRSSDQPLLPTISQLLTEQRLALKLTQQDVARRAGTHPRLVRECESGRRDVWLEALERICDALGLEIQVIPRQVGQVVRHLVCDSFVRDREKKTSL